MSVKNQWYCGVDGQQYGPYTWEQMRAMAEEGRLIADSYVRREVDQQWLTASQVPGLLKKKSKPAGPQLAVAAKKAARSTSASLATPPAAPPVQTASSPAAVKVRAVASGAASGPIPVGSAVTEAPAPPPVGFALQVSPAKSLAADTDDDEEPKKSKALLIVGILAGVVLVVGVAGAGLLVWSMRAASRAQAELKAAAEKAAADLAAAIPPPGSEANPASAAASVNPEVPAASTPPAAKSADDSAAAKLVSSMAGWTDITRSPGIKILEVSLKVNNVWLAADEAGTRLEPASGTASGAKYVFVELRLTNNAKAARNYTSWNVTAGTSAVLADAAGQPLAFVPPSATPAASRLSSVEIPPGQALSDTLVFQAPAGSVEKLKLALAKSALAGNARTRGSHFTFEIPLEVLLRGSSAARPVDPAVAPGDGPLAASQAPLTDASTPPPPIVAPPPAAPAPAAPAAPPGDPKFDPKAFDLQEIQGKSKAEAEMPAKAVPDAKAGKAKGDGK